MKHVPKHRGAPVRPDLVEKPRRAIGTTLVFTSVAVAATGVTIAGGLFTGAAPTSMAIDPVGADDGSTAATADPARAALAAGSVIAARSPELSRSSDRREASDPLKEAALAEPEGPAKTGSENLADADPSDIGRALLSEFGYSSDQFGCLDSLFTRESGWNIYADNPSSSAYGIPQALPGSKMASAGADWATNPVTQIRWGLGYIQDRYGSPCGAWGHSQSYGWY
ncbi:hypothetical protein BH11ACT8_BH11ACT8_03460 [soil metagenome]